MIITFDIETIPTQCSDVVARLAKTVKAPLNYKDEEKFKPILPKSKKPLPTTPVLTAPTEKSYRLPAPLMT